MWMFYDILCVLRYKVFMQSVVANNLHIARPGGVPGTFPLVRSFTAVQECSSVLATEDGLVEGQPVWALIYYCLRSGDTKAALYCAQQAGWVVEPSYWIIMKSEPATIEIFYLKMLVAVELCTYAPFPPSNPLDQYFFKLGVGINILCLY